MSETRRFDAMGRRAGLVAHSTSIRMRQPDRVERKIGPPARVGQTAHGEWTRAALGFARRLGLEGEAAEDALQVVETKRGPLRGGRDRDCRTERSGDSAGSDRGCAPRACVPEGDALGREHRWRAVPFREAGPLDRGATGRRGDSVPHRGRRRRAGRRREPEPGAPLPGQHRKARGVFRSGFLRIAPGGTARAFSWCSIRRRDGNSS